MATRSEEPFIDGRSSPSARGTVASPTDGQPSQIAAPTISLPRGGGAIRGIGEKFATNPVTGSATFRFCCLRPRAVVAFGPQLTLSYDSSNGNSPFWIRWRLALPSIV